jgi:hypothetical protein
MRNETSEADASDLACGAERNNAAYQPPEWADLKPTVRARDDVNRVIKNIIEVRALDDALSPKSSAVTRIRWALQKQAALMEALPRLAVRLLTLVLDTINREGKLGWSNNSHFATLLNADPAPISRAFAALEQYDLIVRTGGHSRRLVWSVGQRRIVCGGRGPSYTFGKAGFETFQQLIDADEVAATATSHAERNCCGGNFKAVEVARTAISNPAKLPIRAGQEESSKPSPNKLSSNELEERNSSERADLFDTGEPGAHVNCTTIIARYIDGHEIKFPKSSIHNIGRQHGLTQSRSELLAQNVLDDWIIDNFRPTRTADALKSAMAKKAIKRDSTPSLEPRADEPASTRRWFKPDEVIAMCHYSKITGAQVDAWGDELTPTLRTLLSGAAVRDEVMRAAKGNNIDECKAALFAAAYRKASRPSDGACGPLVAGQWIWVQPGQDEITALHRVYPTITRAKIIDAFRVADANASSLGEPFWRMNGADRRASLISRIADRCDEHDLNPAVSPRERSAAIDELTAAMNLTDDEIEAVRGKIFREDDWDADFNQAIRYLATFPATEADRRLELALKRLSRVRYARISAAPANANMGVSR